MNRKLGVFVLVLALGLIHVAAFGSPAQAGTPCSEPATKTGTNGHDVLYGTRGRDVIKGGDGNDTIIGRGGGDLLCGEAGNDNLYGRKGPDHLEGGLGNDNHYGESGYDHINGSDGVADNDWLEGGAAGGPYGYGADCFADSGDEHFNCSFPY